MYISVKCCNWKDCLCNYVNVFYTHLYEKCIGMSVKTMIYRLELWRSKEICIEDMEDVEEEYMKGKLMQESNTFKLKLE